MINLDSNKIIYDYMGLFTTDDKWIHPTSTESTYEIIYVTNGNVYIKEDDICYDLAKGDLIILKPGISHYGYKYSEGKTSFYWIHFKSEQNLNKTFFKKNFSKSYLIKELMHYAHMPKCPDYVKNSVLFHLLSVIIYDEELSNASVLASDIFEWTRINVSRTLTVQKIADHFSYNPEYISKIINTHYGVTLKKLIDKIMIDKAKNYLNNTTLSIKEIAVLLDFPSGNTFIKFYKYHENISPLKYRNLYSNTHMNNI